MASQDQWNAVDRLFTGTMLGDTSLFDAALQLADEAGLPQINVAPNQGKFLTVLALATGASRILEVGTLGGYSTLWLAHGLPEDGRIVTLEREARHAAVAREVFAMAGIGHAVEIREGVALETLKEMVAAGEEPFDLVFLDADKASLPEYLVWSLKLSRPGTVIVADNVVRGGEIVNEDTTNPDVRGARRYLELAGADPRLETTAMQTVGAKGYDGFAISVVMG